MSQPCWVKVGEASVDATEIPMQHVNANLVVESRLELS